MKRLTIWTAVLLILSACNLAQEDVPTPDAPAPVLRIDPDQSVQPGCYQFAHGESFTVHWENPAADVQSVEFFRNCTDPSAPMMMCTDRAVDRTPEDGFSVTFTMPETFNEVIITAIAYGTGQDSAVDSGGIVVFVE